MKINRIDHIVLTVHDIDATIKFYNEVLGMQLITFGENRKALKFGNQKINLHLKGLEVEPKANKPTCGSADLCLITTTSIKEVKAELLNRGIEIVEGIIETFGATGPIQSIYFRDPDLNLIEVSNYKQ